MLLLALETSTEWLSVAVGDGTRFAVRRERAGQAHSERVLPLVDAALAEAGASLAALDGIAFGAGPGAFTGLRIACGVAQGLALGADLPVVPVSTLDALAEHAWQAHGWRRVVACLDARMREVYVAALEREGPARWAERHEAIVAKPADVALDVAGWHGAGDGFSRYPFLSGQLALAAHDDALAPDAVGVATIAAPILASGGGRAPEDALPRYVRHRVALTIAEREAGEQM